MAYMQGKAYPHIKLEKIWKEVLLYQFHDILPGSSIHRVYEECNSRYEILKAKLNCIIDETVSYLRNDENSYFAINPVDFERSGYTKHNGEWYKYLLAPYSACKLEKCRIACLIAFFQRMLLKMRTLRLYLITRDR